MSTQFTRSSPSRLGLKRNKSAVCEVGRVVMRLHGSDSNSDANYVAILRVATFKSIENSLTFP